MIDIHNVTKTFGSKGSSPSVHNVTLKIHDGETLALVGASGCGKTTLLKMINRLIQPCSGQIFIDNQNIMNMPSVELRRGIGYVFQNLGLFPHMTVEANVALPLRLIGLSRENRLVKAREYIELVGLDPESQGKQYPTALSGGQRQRVAVARALINEPKYLLMDEPFGAVDAITRRQLQRLLAPLRDQLSKTILLVTHDIDEARILGDRIAVMDQGSLLQIGTYDFLLKAPATPFVSRLLQAADGTGIEI